MRRGYIELHASLEDAHVLSAALQSWSISALEK